MKGNKAIQVPGLERLCQALTSSKISRIEIDETNRSSHVSINIEKMAVCDSRFKDPQAYVQLVKKMNAICTVNKTFKESSNDEIANISQLVSRKVSLSCEPRYVVVPETATTPVTVESPIISPMPSPRPPKNRFQITKVQDPNTRPNSRFKVTRVVSSPDEDLSIGKFANVRSSVSSNDSVDSLQLDIDSD